MLYLDTSALVKLIFAERESTALERFIAGRDLAVSGVSRVELRRVALRADPAQLPACDHLLSACYEVVLSGSVLDRAGIASPPSLRSLDAIHLASAEAMGDELDGIVAYDVRLLAAARTRSFETFTPG